MKLRKYLPILEWFPTYEKKWLTPDVLAGITVGVMLIPQGMAYALLAGVPPIYGLYAGLIPLFLYAILGTSRQLSIGPVAISSLLVLAGIRQIAEPFSAQYVELVILTGLLIGVMQAGLSLLRMGFLVNFLSHPVVAGFTSAAAIIIGVSQLKFLFGIDVPRSDHLEGTLGYIFSHLNEANIITFLLGMGGIGLLLLLRWINPKIPSALILVALGIGTSFIFHLENYGVEIVGEIPDGLPLIVMPTITFENIKLVMPTVFAVTIIGIVESIGIAKVLESKHDYYRVRPNQELLAIGLSKIGGAFFQSIPTSASFTRSAVNNESGAKTGIASIVTVFLVVLTLLFMTPLFYYLPTAILASIIMVSIKSLFDYGEAVRLYQLHRSEFYMMLTTFIITLIFGIEEGVFTGILVSLGYMIFRNSRPHIAVLGRLPNSRRYRNIERYPNAQQFEEILIMRFDAQLYFANASYFKDAVFTLIKAKGSVLKLFILDCASIHDIDSSGLEALKEVHKTLSKQDIKFYLSGLIGPSRDILYGTGLTQAMGEKTHFMYIHDAMLYYDSLGEGQIKGWTKDALQNNVQNGNAPFGNL